MKKVYFETFGCRLNRAEALEDEARALSLGYVPASGHASADIVVVRGCAVTQRAQHDCEAFVRNLKAKYPEKRLVLTGCMVGAKKFAFPSPVDGSFPVSHRMARAYLRVQDGCSGLCTFCIVPKFRGKSLSTPFERVLAKAERFIEAGYREIVVTGCNLALYASHDRRLPRLVDELAALDPGVRVRIGSVEPFPGMDELIGVMAARQNVCNFLHIPVQSGSNRVLKLMRRPYEVREVDDLIMRALKAMPQLGLGCDLIAGFPDEGEVDYASTMSFLERHPFTKVHVFPYSERPGTPAAAMPEQIDVKVRAERAHALAKTADTMRRNFAKRFLGREVEVLIEGHRHERGWTAEYFPFERVGEYDSHHGALRRQLRRYLVTNVKGDILYGRPVGGDGR